MTYSKVLVPFFDSGLAPRALATSTNSYPIPMETGNFTASLSDYLDKQTRYHGTTPLIPQDYMTERAQELNLLLQSL